MQQNRANEFGCKLVEVTSHAGARPSHAVWQGQVYSLDGDTSKYKDFKTATGYGTGEGSCGWNCYHNFFPFFEGMSERVFDRDPARELHKSNDQLYEEKQHQRYLERQIRKSRRECAVPDAGMNGANDDATRNALKGEFQRASVTLKQRETRLADYCAEHKLTYDSTRVTTAGYSKSTASKAT